MLTLLPVKAEEVVMRRREIYRTHLGCRVESEKRAQVYDGTCTAGHIVEHVTLSAAASVFERACL